ncbi:class I SAM-dependent methyltransferase [Paracoccus sediminis]|uniref:Methyltransferase domain-containing protein n=1 Tax=Paracoccus sediminis TaxID=1214787 RepID=A0A238Y5S0_9RHOB|nr:class I SAM-dependent methyltransferase [Paracoccus sediminis]SNR66616.1 Methyltransferase domain-containing protein [Paracoccus sediminis]
MSLSPALSDDPSQSPGAQRVRIIRDLLGGPTGSLLDIGSGRVAPDYPYLDMADRITCIDWNPRIIPPTPDRIEIRSGDFLDMDIPAESYDAAICADVFEHVPLEREAAFAAACIRALRPGGLLIVSVPHAGRHAWLDPFEVKPALHRMLFRLGLYRRTHNGFCDIRKGHKHYTADEIRTAFAPLEPVATRLWGYVCDPLLSWSEGLGRKTGVAPFRNHLARGCAAELGRDYGPASFNLAMALRKKGRNT